jgi:ABC-2 type transport system ATP-binding protein
MKAHGRYGQGGPAVSLHAVTKIYRPTPALVRVLVRTQIRHEVVALGGIDLEVLSGQIMAIVGPNGAGKTTLLRILTGLTTATSGDVRVLGHDPRTEGVRVRRLLGFMPADDRSLFLRLSCLENLIFHARLQHVPAREMRRTCLEVLEAVGLSGREKSAAVSLSAGMRARLQLARAILHRPRLLILDEPTGAVDPVASHELLGLIQRLVDQYQMAALISSHRLEEIEALHSNVILLDRGRILHHGDLDRLRAEWQQPCVEIVFDSEHAAEAAEARLLGFGYGTRDGTAALSWRLPAEATTGQLLERIDGLLGHLVHVNERPMPLRDLLATVYADARPEVGEVS